MDGDFLAGIESRFDCNITRKGAFVGPNEVVQVSFASDTAWHAAPCWRR